MIEFKSEDAGQVEMVDLFSIDDTVYQVPAKPRLNVALRYLDEARRRGDMFAGMQLLEDLLGAEGYKALMGYDGLQSEDLNQVLTVASKLALGSLEEEPNPKSGKGSKK